MEQLDRLIKDNKVTIFDNNRLNEPLIKINDEIMIITDYIFYNHSYKHTHIDIKSHFNGEWFSIEINRHIQRLRDHDIHDLEADTIDMKIKLQPLEILAEIMEELINNHDKQHSGALLNVLDDYITYIDFLIEENLAEYNQRQELLFIEKDEDLNVTEYHRLVIDKNKLQNESEELIDISWFIDVIGICTNELKRLETINTQFI